MQINYTGHGIEITDPLRTVINKKFERVTRRYSNIMSINITLRVQKLNHTVDANVLINGDEIIASGTDENMYKAIDDMMLKLDRQLRKHKEKESEHR